MRASVLLCLAAAVLAPAGSLFAQTAAPAHPVTVSGYLQTQYELTGRDGTTIDRAYLRRANLIVEAAPVQRWTGRLQVDFGPATIGASILVRDAWFRYTGWEAHGLTLTVGNQKLPYSRSWLTPSTRRGLVERAVTGENRYGTPGRGLSLRLDLRSPAPRLQWSAAVASTLVSPDSTSLRVDSITVADSTWTEGILAAGRVEWHPLGPAPRDQGWFGGPSRFVVGFAGYAWHNDGDRTPYTVDGHGTSDRYADVDDARGIEVSGGYRGHRASLDAEYHRVAAATLDPTYTGGLYVSGHTHVQASSVEGGWMLVARRVEALAMLDGLVVDTRAATTWRPAVGATYYVSGHDLKVSVMYRHAVNDGGVPGSETDTTYLQAQIVF